MQNKRGARSGVLQGEWADGRAGAAGTNSASNWAARESAAVADAEFPLTVESGRCTNRHTCSDFERRAVENEP